MHHNFRAYVVAGAWRCGRQYFGTGGRASYGRQQQRTHVAAREDGEHDTGMSCRRLQQLLLCRHVDEMVQRWHWLSCVMPSWSILHRRRVCWGEMFGFVRSAFQLLTVSLGSITESVWGVV